MLSKLNLRDTRIYSHIPIDIEPALDILEMYKKRSVEEGLYEKKDIESLKKLSQRMIGIDKLEDYLIDRAFEAPVIILIEDFIYKMEVWMAQAGEGTEPYKVYENMCNAIDDVSEYFL